MNLSLVIIRARISNEEMTPKYAAIYAEMKHKICGNG